MGFFVSFHRLGVCASRPSVRSADSQFHNKCPRSPSSRASAQHYPEQPLLFPLALHCSCQDPAYRLITAAINRPARHASHTHTHTHTRKRTCSCLLLPAVQCPRSRPRPTKQSGRGSCHLELNPAEPHTEAIEYKHPQVSISPPPSPSPSQSHSFVQCLHHQPPARPRPTV